eukprot:gene8997-16640_t
MQSISQLLEIIGSDETTSREQSRSTHSVTGDSTVGSSRPRPRQGQQHEASGPGRPASTNNTNRYHPYAQHNGQRHGLNRTNNNQSMNAVSELRRRFPTAFAATRRPSSANFTGKASRGRTPGRPFASSTATRDVMVLKAGEETVPSRAEKLLLLFEHMEGLNLLDNLNPPRLALHLDQSHSPQYLQLLYDLNLCFPVCLAPTFALETDFSLLIMGDYSSVQQISPVTC